MSVTVARSAPVGSAHDARQRVGFIVGPTGSGKSALALALAERIGAEIVNCDSRQVYRGMDIGTAKPSADELRRVAHHLIDIRVPDDPLDAATFAALARKSIAEIVSRKRLPLVVGGSGLYLRALRGGLFAGPPASRELRDEFAAVAAEHGVPTLHQELGAVDPAAASRIGRNDLHRIIRALEVHQLTGEPISRLQVRHGFADSPYQSLVVAIALDRKELYTSIDRRFDAMMRAGFLDEVRTLLAAGYSPAKAPLCTIGYKHLASVIRGQMALDDAVALAKRDTRRFAKRQLTWFRRESDILWLEPGRALQQGARLFEDFFSTGASAASG
ncbi:MAG: tRNA (adenosine(37)-N6)-dimethylallyltransferase MiaA [Candidatus Binataceae bacterium]